MTGKSFFLLIAALTASAALAQPATNIDGPAGRFDDDLISNLEGTWRVSRQIRGKAVENSARARWVLNHQFLQLHMKDAGTPARYEAIVHIGYVYADKQYVAYWNDTYGAKFAAVGRGVRNGNSVEFRFEYPDGPFFNTFSWDPKSGTWSCHLESVGPDGTRTTFARDTLVRKP